MRAALIAVVVLAACTSSAGAATRLAQPAQVWLDSATETSAVLRWSAVPGATAYQIRRSGTAIGTVTTTGAQVNKLAPATYGAYTIVAVAKARRPSLPSDPIPAVTLPSSSCTRYVSTSGSDASSGSSPSAAWRTLSHLVDEWQPGDVGCVEGSFVEDVTITRGGTAGAKVTLRARPGADAALRGRIWVAKGANDVVIAGMRLDGRAIHDTARHSLPSPTVNASRTMLIANDISNARSRVCVVLGSIRGYGSALMPTLAYNRVHDCGRRGANTHHGIYVERARYGRIVHNAIFDNADRGIQLYPDAQRMLIEGNVIDGNGEGVIFSGAEGYASSRNIVLRNVISRSQLRSNVEHYWEGRAGSRNVVARNCLGGARQGNFATPIRGYRAVRNTTGRLRFVDRAGDDLRLARGSGCASLLRSRMLPLARW